MKIRKKSVEPVDFDGLKIIDYTSDKNMSSSMAEITVPPGVQHKMAWSKRSDKFYYIVSGCIHFQIEDETYDLFEGDACVVEKGRRFCYSNLTKNESKLILFHTPSFDMESEVFEE